LKRGEVKMLLKTIPFVEEFVKELDLCLGRHNPQLRLTFSQRYWLSFCLSGILLTNSVCWARFERASLGKYTKSVLSARVMMKTLQREKTE
jgi:hypothetical protein